MKNDWKIIAVGTSFVLLFMLLSQCVPSEGEHATPSTPTPTPHMIKECLVGGVFCKVLQITNLETGCITTTTYRRMFSGPSDVHVTCP